MNKISNEWPQQIIFLCCICCWRNLTETILGTISIRIIRILLYAQWKNNLPSRNMLDLLSVSKHMELAHRQSYWKFSSIVAIRSMKEIPLE